MRKIDIESSVGSNSSIRSLSSSSSIDCEGARQRQQQEDVWKKNKDNDSCFSCKRKGHWAHQCPQKNTNTNNTTSNGENGEVPVPVEWRVDLMCPCGAGYCNILISKTPLNPNRNFYRCPLFGPRACKFFNWCDDLFLITGTPPPCPCGAGLCSVFIRHHYHQPSYSFVCPIKKGQGACNFIQPVGATTYQKVDGSVSTSFSPKSTLTHCFSGEETTSRPSSSSISTFSDKILVEDESSVVSSQLLETKSSVPLIPNQHPTLQLDTSCEIPWDEKMWEGMKFHEQEEDSPKNKEREKDEEPSIHYHRRRKRLRDWAPKNDDSLIHYSGVDCNIDILPADLEEEPCRDTLSIRTSAYVLIPDEVLVHPQQQRQAQICCKIFSTAGPTNILRVSPTTCVHGSSSLIPNCLKPTVIYQMLGFQVEGWCGRLLFPPSHSLTFPAPKPFFCCVFPSFDLISVPGDDYKYGTESRKLSIDCGQQLGDDAVKVGPSNGGSVVQAPPPPPKMYLGNNNINNINNINNNIMTVSILDVFKQAATRLEEGLLNVLESMEPQEHKSMVSEASLVFDALDNLSVVDYSSFKEQVMGFIDCAVSVSELESSSSSAAISQGNCLQQQEVVDKYMRLQMELENVSIQCSEAYVALTASDNRLNVLTQEEAQVKEMLSRIQGEILCCREQNEEINSQLDKLTRDKQKSELSVEVAKDEVERARRFRQQREAQLGVAIASFEKARSKLRDGELYVNVLLF